MTEDDIQKTGLTVLVMHPPGFLPVATTYLRLTKLPLSATVGDVLKFIKTNFGLDDRWTLRGWNEGFGVSTDLDFNEPVLMWSLELNPVSRLILYRRV